MKAHPAAEAFPMMDEGRLRALAESLKSRGLDDPIVTLDGQILDGRNRYKACGMAGVAPRFVPFVGGGDPWEYVWTHNGQRRDLDPGQRAAVRLRIDRGSADYNAEQDRKRKAADSARSDAAREQHAVSTPRHGERFGALSFDNAPKPRRDDYEFSHQDLAVRASVSEATAARVQSLANKRPDLLDKVADGALKLTEAMRQVKREEVAAKVEPLPSDKYRVIYADPPWQYNDSRAGIDGYDQTAAEHHYPTMSVADLSALEVGKLAAADSVLFCWATFPLLTDALEVVRAWGFSYKTAFVWAKGRPNFGHYHNASAELLLVCTRGSGVPDADKREDQVQTIARTGKHSSKPEEFRKLIDRLYATGKRIELFRRGQAPKGWAIWGNEAA